MASGAEEYAATRKKSINFVSAEDALEEYIPSPKARMVSEYEFISGMFGASGQKNQMQKKKQIRARSSRNQSAAGRVSGPKQFGTDSCESFSKVSKIVGHQYMSLKEK